MNRGNTAPRVSNQLTYNCVAVAFCRGGARERSPQGLGARVGETGCVEQTGNLPFQVRRARAFSVWKDPTSLIVRPQSHEEFRSAVSQWAS